MPLKKMSGRGEKGKTQTVSRRDIERQNKQLSLAVAAAWAGDADALARQLARGADPCGRDVDGETMLSMVIRDTRLDCLELLIEAGANVEMIDLGGHAPAIRAACFGMPLALETLLKAGADANRQDRHGRGPVHRAASASGASQKACARCLEILSAHGADLEAKDAGGWTPLMLAAVTGSAASVGALVRLGVSLDELNRGGLSAAAAAAHHGHEECLRLLIQAGAKMDVGLADVTALICARKANQSKCATLIEAALIEAELSSAPPPAPSKASRI